MNLASYIHEHTTVTDFAKKIGKSRMQVHRYIRGENLTKRVIEEIVVATDGNVQPVDFFTAAHDAPVEVSP
jgi:hypothetical protein